MKRHKLAHITLCALFTLCLSAPAFAQETEQAAPSDAQTAHEAPASSLALGLNLRTDLGAHPLRIDVGWQRKNADLVLVLDPMFWTDGQSSTDLLASWIFENKARPFVGWRLNTVALREGRQLQQNLVTGMGLGLPEFFDGKLRGAWGFELAMMVVKHGGGLPSEVLSFASARNYLDLVNFGMFVRLDFHLGLGGKR